MLADQKMILKGKIISSFSNSTYIHFSLISCRKFHWIFTVYDLAIRQIELRFCLEGEEGGGGGWGWGWDFLILQYV